MLLVLELDELVVVDILVVLVRQELVVVCPEDEVLDELVAHILDKTDEMVDLEYVVIEVEVDEVRLVNETV